MSINIVILKGNLSTKPELSYTPSGVAVCKFNLAINHSYTKKDKTQVKSVVFIRITAWNKQAEACAKYLVLGQEAFIKGRLNQDIWEKDGTKHNVINVIADPSGIDFGRKPKEGAAPDADNRPANNNQLPLDDAEFQEDLPSAEEEAKII